MMQRPERTMVSPRDAEVTELSWCLLPAPVSFHPFVAARCFLPVSGDPVALGLLHPMTRSPHPLTARPLPVSVDPNRLRTRPRRLYFVPRRRGRIRNIDHAGTAHQKGEQDDDTQKKSQVPIHHPPPCLALSFLRFLTGYLRLPTAHS